jgi:tetratricopeptide (TPR) repeat protein
VRRFIRNLSLLLVLCAPLAGAAEPASKVTLDTSETMFVVTTALNACGYDQEVARSEPVRAQVRAEVEQAVRNSPEAQAAREKLCGFYRDHQRDDNARTLAQYVSLALNLGPPPEFKTAATEADLPPDAGYVLGVLSSLRRFYAAAGLERIWQAHQAQYEGLADRFAPELKRSLLATDLYLRLPISGYAGRQLLVLLEPMTPPSQVNSRNYGRDYYLVVSPEAGKLRVDAIRHAYLHFTLDPMFADRGLAMDRLEPLLNNVQTAPLDDSFKRDVTLLVVESLIRAVEARTAVAGRGRQAEQERQTLAERAAEEGFILTPYFAQRLAEFEKGAEGFTPSFANWLHGIDVEHENKRAARIAFLKAAPAGAHFGSGLRAANPLAEAENRLAAGDLAAAIDLAQRALKAPGANRGQALFILARAAVESRDLSGAQGYFERTLQATSDPELRGWSHVFLGRILDVKGERPQALEHYRQALATAGGNEPLRAAAERGLAQPLARPATAPPEEPGDPADEK